MGESSLGPAVYKPNALATMPRRPSQKEGTLGKLEGALVARRRALGPALQFFLFFEKALLARRRTLGPALQFFCFSKEYCWHVDDHWTSLTVFLFLALRRGAFGTSREIGTSLSVFLFFRFSRSRRSTFGTSTDIGTSLTVFLFFSRSKEYARRRTLGPALQFFCVFCFSKEYCWHVDGHWDQPYSFFVFLILARRRGAFGTSTDIGTSLTDFLFFCFSKEYCWHVDGHWDQP